MKKKYYILLFIVFLLTCILFYQNPYSINNKEILCSPSFKHILGCDNLGRDIFSRLVLGSIYTLSISFLAISLSLIVGVVIGGLAGYYESWVDGVIMSIIEIIIAIPGIIIALGVIIVLGVGIDSLITAIFIIYIPRCVNIIRGVVKKEKHMEYIVAAKTYGVSDIRILYNHILPNIIKPVLVCFTTGFAGAILTEVGLGYLGLGIQPPYPTLGNILNQSQSYFLSAPWFTIAPGLAIVFTVYQIKKLERRETRY